MTVLAKDLDEKGTAEKLVSKLEGADSVVNGLIICGKLKTAYLNAVKIAKRDLVQKILHEAQKQRDENMIAICSKYLNSN
jgi:hypothetical protein